MILKSQLAMVEGDLNKAETILEEAKFLSLENNLHHLGREVSIYEKKIRQKISKMKKMLLDNEDLIERLRYSGLIDYLHLSQGVLNEEET